MYSHKLPDGMEIDARQYELDLLPVFIEYIDSSWLPERSYAYFSERDKKALPFLPQICPQLAPPSTEESIFNKAIEKAAPPFQSGDETRE